MKLLVVTPTLGDSPWLEACTSSVARWAGDHLHVLVAPPEKAEKLRMRLPSLLVTQEADSRGMYAAINAGLAINNDWDAFTYLNDDDLLLKGFAAAARAAANAEGRPLVAYGGVRLIDAGGRRLGGIPVSPLPTINRLLYEQRIEPVYQQGTVVTRAAFTQLRGFDSNLRGCGDTEFLARACVTHVPFARVGGTMAAFRLRHGQLTKNRATMIAERNCVDQKLGLVAPRRTVRHHWARALFRLANLPVYAERVARFGFISFDQLIERVG